MCLGVFLTVLQISLSTQYLYLQNTQLAYHLIVLVNIIDLSLSGLTVIL